MVSFPVLVSISVNKNGHRRILGIDIVFEEICNVLYYVPYKEKENLACYLKQIFNSPTKEMATTVNPDDYPEISGQLSQSQSNV